MARDKKINAGDPTNAVENKNDEKGDKTLKNEKDKTKKDRGNKSGRNDNAQTGVMVNRSYFLSLLEFMSILVYG